MPSRIKKSHYEHYNKARIIQQYLCDLMDTEHEQQQVSIDFTPVFIAQYQQMQHI
jgi:hypothetical protein